MTWILFIGGGLAVILLIVGVIDSVNSERSLVEQRLGRFLGDEKTTPDKESDRSLVTDWVNKRVEKSSFGDRIARELARADLKLKVAEYFALYFITVFLGALIFGFLGGLHPVSFLVGAVIGAFAPRFYVKRQQRQRLNRFNDQLGDMLNLMVNGLRAGYSTMQAMEAIKYLTGTGTNLKGKLLIFEGEVMSSTALDVQRVPSCPVCGEQQR